MSSYNVDFINPLLEAVLNVLSTMANVEVEPAAPFLNTKRTAVGDITGQISINGFAQGIIALSLSESVILKIVNNMLLRAIRKSTMKLPMPSAS